MNIFHILLIPHSNTCYVSFFGNLQTKPFTSFINSRCLFLCWIMPTSFLKSHLVFSLAMYGIYLNSCLCEFPSLCHDVWAVRGPGASLDTYSPSLSPIHTHTHRWITSVWFMVAEGEWSSSVFLRFFFFCLSISNKQSLPLCSETKRMWFSASLADNLLSHYLLHLKKLQQSRKWVKCQPTAPNKWDIFEALVAIFVSTLKGSNVSHPRLFYSKSTRKLVIHTLYSFWACSLLSKKPLNSSMTVLYAHFKKESQPILDPLALTEDWTNIDWKRCVEWWHAVFLLTVPQVLKSCTEFIEKHGVVDGIYRLSGIASNIQKLR